MSVRSYLMIFFESLVIGRKKVIIVNLGAAVFLTVLLMLSLYCKEITIKKEMVVNILTSFMIFFGVVISILIAFFVLVFSNSEKFLEKKTNIRLYNVRITLKKELMIHILALLKFSLFLLAFFLVGIVFSLKPEMMPWVVGICVCIAIYIVLQLISLLERLYVSFFKNQKSISIFAKKKAK